MIEPTPDFRLGYTLFAAISGAITSLAFMKWKDMDWVTICLTLFVGFSFSLFVAPWMAHTLLRIDEGDARALSMLTYVAAAGAHALIPRLVNWVSNAIGAKE